MSNAWLLAKWQSRPLEIGTSRMWPSQAPQKISRNRRGNGYEWFWRCRLKSHRHKTEKTVSCAIKPKNIPIQTHHEAFYHSPCSRGCHCLQCIVAGRIQRGRAPSIVRPQVGTLIFGIVLMHLVYIYILFAQNTHSHTQCSKINQNKNRRVMPATMVRTMGKIRPQPATMVRTMVAIRYVPF